MPIRRQAHLLCSILQPAQEQAEVGHQDLVLVAGGLVFDDQFGLRNPCGRR